MDVGRAGAGGRAEMRVVILGFDGFSPDLAFHWAGQGRLPHLDSMMARGAWGPLRSVIHPITPAAWTSMVTGTNPGRHGIFDFGVRCDGRYEPRLATSRDCREPDMFGLLSRAGRRVGAFNVPLTYPPSGVNGFMVTGMHTPHLEAGCYPRALAGEIRQIAPDYSIDVMSYWYEQREAFVSDVYRMLEARRKAALHLWRRYRPDLFMAVFVAADRIQHALWAESFPSSGEIENDVIGGEVFRVYKALDDILGEFQDELEDGDVLFLVSDHGFGPLYKDVYLNTFLQQTGLLVTHPVKRSGETRWYRYPKRTLPHIPAIGSPGKTIRSIDWSRTKAYSHGMFGNVYINTAGREPAGIVQPGSEFQAALGQLVDELTDFRDPQDGQPVVDHILLGRELYRGPAVTQAPDLVLIMRNYAYMTRGGREFDGDRLVSAPKVNHSGNHRLDGCLVVAGQGVAPSGRLPCASIMDICPTVLGLLGANAPAHLDGVPLTDVFPGRRLTPPQREGVFREALPSQGQANPTGREFHADERATVESRLRGLGYLD